MSARDDYPLPEGPTARSAQRRDMLDEIDRLRLNNTEATRSIVRLSNENARLRTRLADCYGGEP